MKTKNFAFSDALADAANNAQNNSGSGSGNFWTGLFGAAQSVFGANKPQAQPEPVVVEEKKSNTGLIVGIILAVVVVGAVLYFTLRK
ncbi:MAG: hypothetical protein PHE56_13100 [Bacteroidales bacterium]|nr:hypothetical protein [Bacteroidales bacterium]